MLGPELTMSASVDGPHACLDTPCWKKLRELRKHWLRSLSDPGSNVALLCLMLMLGCNIILPRSHLKKAGWGEVNRTKESTS